MKPRSKAERANSQGFPNYTLVYSSKVTWGVHVKESPLTTAFTMNSVTGTFSKCLWDYHKDNPTKFIQKTYYLLHLGCSLGIYGGNGQLVPFFRVNRSYSGFYAVHQAGCSLGNDLLCVWIT